ncbi:CHAT domain-containing protein [Oscillochloris sp. ZM17-4]|nr:CHAT domain-containing protein [Oscillochloris sp. ZM17-4]
MVLPESLLPAWEQARGYFIGESQKMHVRVVLDAQASELHTLYWERLRDPQTGDVLSMQEGGSFARMVPVNNLFQRNLPIRANLRTIVAIANPSDIAQHDLRPVDVEEVVREMQIALGTISTELLIGNQPSTVASLENILNCLRGGSQILTLICHGKATGVGSMLYLVGNDGRTKPIEGADIAQAINDLEPAHRPLLAMLIACDSATQEAAPIVAVGPLLASIGIPAVVAMQAKVSTHAANRFVDTFLFEIARDGQIDRALAAARKSMGNEGWIPVLWLRERDGRIWHEPEQHVLGKSAAAARSDSGERARDQMIQTLKGDAERFYAKLLLNEHAIPLAFDRLSRDEFRIWRKEGSQAKSPTSVGEISVMSAFLKQRELLILGEPGSGKTSTLFELALALLTIAEHDGTARIPVVIPLATWKSTKRPFEEWLGELLFKMHQVPQGIIKRWIEQDKLIFLLDGLDEVDALHRSNCVESINAFISYQKGDKHLRVPTVISCRIQEYEQLVEMPTDEKLTIHDCIVLRKLTTQQVFSYLSRISFNTTNIREGLNSDPKLLEFAQTPLVLGFMVVAYQDKSIDELKNTSDEIRYQRLFRAYIIRMFSRRLFPVASADVVAPRLPRPKRILRNLTWLSNKLEKNEFLLEEIQPHWLTLGQWLYVLLLLGLVALPIPWLLFGASTAGMLSLSLMIGVALTVRLGKASISPMDAVNRLVPLEGLADALEDVGVSALLLPEIFMKGLGYAGDALLTIGGVLSAIPGALMGMLSGIDGIIDKLIRVALLGFGAWFIYIAVQIASQICSLGGWVTKICQRSMTVTGDDPRSIPPLNIRVFPELPVDFHMPEITVPRLSLSTTDLRMYLFTLIWLLATIVLAVFVIAFVVGQLNALQQIQQPQRQFRPRYPNERIRMSLINGLMMALIYGTLGGVIIGFLASIFHAPWGGLRMGLTGALLIGLLMGYVLGGMAWTQHYLVRLALWFTQLAPLNYVRFLDQAYGLVLLLKAGPSYRFVHEQLKVYFRELNDAEIRALEQDIIADDRPRR